MLSVLIMPSPAHITPLPVNALLNILAANVPNNIPTNPTFCSFDWFLIVSLIPFTDNPDSSSDLTIFMMLFISSFESINVVKPDPNISFWIAATVADVAAVNPNGIKMLLANGLSKST